MTRLSIEGVAYRHNGAHESALDGVDLTVAPGETVALLGPNGSGKSTLLRIAAGLLQPTRGRTSIDGRDVRTLSPRERARAIAVVPQHLEAWPNIAVEEFVLGGRYAYRRTFSGPSTSDREAVAQALAATGLAPFADRALPSLSGGERQRALVARALAQDAGLILCDEPTASLDVDQQLAILERVAHATSEGRAVLLVTHDLNLAAQFGDRVALLVAGRLTAEGAPADVLCREVLEPVYGGELHFASLPGSGRPLVVPKRSPPAGRTDMIDAP